MSASESLLIRRLRFWLIVAMVCTHTDLRTVCSSLSNLPLFAAVTDVFVDLICRAAVPLLSIFSGYLFYINARKRTYVEQLQHKSMTLLVPYVLWNIICIIIVALCQAVVPSFRLLLHKAVSDCTLTDFLWMFWDISRATGLDTDQHGPIIGQFWFLQSLMVLIIFTPLLRPLVSKVPYIILPTLFVVDVLQLIPPLPGIHIGIYFYFILGAVIALHRPHFTPLLKQWGWIALPFLIITYILKRHLMPSLPDGLYIVEKLLMAVSILWLTWKVLNRHSDRSHNDTVMQIFLTSGSFFVFAFHRFVSAVSTNLARNGHLPIDNSLSALAVYILSTAAVIFICLAVYTFMKRFLPSITSMLTGGR